MPRGSGKALVLCSVVHDDVDDDDDDTLVPGFLGAFSLCLVMLP